MRYFERKVLIIEWGWLKISIVLVNTIIELYKLLFLKNYTKEKREKIDQVTSNNFNSRQFYIVSSKEHRMSEN